MEDGVGSPPCGGNQAEQVGGMEGGAGMEQQDLEAGRCCTLSQGRAGGGSHGLLEAAGHETVGEQTDLPLAAAPTQLR